MMRNFFRQLLLVVVIISLGACSAQQTNSSLADGNQTEVAQNDQEIWDPLEPVNRKIFWFNDKFDLYIGEPVASGYDYITTDSVQTGVRNFFRNLRLPAQVLSNVLQLKFGAAVKDAGRFAINSTAGFLGLWDIAAEHLELPYQYQDVGTALGYYGVGEGPYLVLPILGPSNVRDTFSYVTEIFLNPLYWLYASSAFDSGTDTIIGASSASLQYVNTRARYLEILNDLKENSVDYYLGQQSYFTQYRRGEIKDTLPKDESADDKWYEDDLDSELEESSD